MTDGLFIGKASVNRTRSVIERPLCERPALDFSLVPRTPTDTRGLAVSRLLSRLCTADLNHLFEGGQAMEAVVAVERDARIDSVIYFDPEDYLLDIVRRASANRQDVSISADGVGELIVLGSRGEYFAHVPDMGRLCEMPADRFAVELLKSRDMYPPAAYTVGRDIDELLWQAAFHASQGRLMAGCYRDDVVQLTHWPNLSRLPMTPNSIRIAALLTRYPTSITLASRLLKLDLPELYQFYSAARCAGLARSLNRKAEEPQLAPHRNHNLLSLLLRKIARL